MVQLGYLGPLPMTEQNWRLLLEVALLLIVHKSTSFLNTFATNTTARPSLTLPMQPTALSFILSVGSQLTWMAQCEAPDSGVIHTLVHTTLGYTKMGNSLNQLEDVGRLTRCSKNSNPSHLLLALQAILANPPPVNPLHAVLHQLRPSPP